MWLWVWRWRRLAPEGGVKRAAVFAGLALTPDLDVVAFVFHVPYEASWGIGAPMIFPPSDSIRARPMKPLSLEMIRSDTLRSQPLLSMGLDAKKVTARSLLFL